MINCDATNVIALKSQYSTKIFTNKHCYEDIDRIFSQI